MNHHPLRDKLITIFGGTGFIGRYLVRELAKTGAMIRVVSRDPQRGLFLKTSGYVGQVVLERGSLNEPNSLKAMLEGTDVVINLIGILFEHGSQRFANVHARGAERLAKAAAEAGVERLLHMSALGVDKAGRSKYARTKHAGEQAVLAAFPNATLFRPSVVFGPEDDFINRFASMASAAPVIPIVGGKTRFQPVYVVDVAQAMVNALLTEQSKGVTYELGGPHIYRLADIIRYIMKETGHERPLISLPTLMASVIGTAAEILPNPPLTSDQVKLLQYDNVISSDVPGFEELGIKPTALEVVAPDYLVRYRRGGQFARHSTS